MLIFAQQRSVSPFSLLYAKKVETKIIANRSYKWFFKHDFSVDKKNEEDMEISESELAEI